MRTNEILLRSLVSTSMMTLFSYSVSEYQRENFKEPELLGTLPKVLLPEKLKNLALPLGWSSHYGIGCLWSIGIEWFMNKYKIKPGVKSGLIAGGVSGLTAILAWKLFFTLHPNPPRILFHRYYGHLCLAHFVFCLSFTLSDPGLRKDY